MTRQVWTKQEIKDFLSWHDKRLRDLGYKGRVAWELKQTGLEWICKNVRTSGKAA